MRKLYFAAATALFLATICPGRQRSFLRDRRPARSYRIAARLQLAVLHHDFRARLQGQAWQYRPEGFWLQGQG